MTSTDSTTDACSGISAQKEDSGLVLNAFATNCTWGKHFDEDSGDYYFFNTVTGESQWDAPVSMSTIRHDGALQYTHEPRGRTFQRTWQGKKWRSRSWSPPRRCQLLHTFGRIDKLVTHEEEPETDSRELQFQSEMIAELILANTVAFVLGDSVEAVDGDKYEPNNAAKSSEELEGKTRLKEPEIKKQLSKSQNRRDRRKRFKENRAAGFRSESQKHEASQQKELARQQKEKEQARQQKEKEQASQQKEKEQARQQKEKKKEQARQQKEKTRSKARLAKPRSRSAEVQQQLCGTQVRTLQRTNARLGCTFNVVFHGGVL